MLEGEGGMGCGMPPNMQAKVQKRLGRPSVLRFCSEVGWVVVEAIRVWVSLTLSATRWASGKGGGLWDASNAQLMTSALMWIGLPTSGCKPVWPESDESGVPIICAEVGWMMAEACRGGQRAFSLSAAR